jgi:hypothetical protein
MKDVTASKLQEFLKCFKERRIFEADTILKQVLEQKLKARKARISREIADNER